MEYEQLKEESKVPYVDPIEVNKIEQLYELFMPGLLPNIVIVYEEEERTEGTITAMINSAKHYNGMVNFYLL